MPADAPLAGPRYLPTAYATPKTIRPYSLGQNCEWDAVSRMLAAGLVTVCPDPMAVGFVRVSAVSTQTTGDIRPHTAREDGSGRVGATPTRKGVLARSGKEYGR